MEWWQWLGWVFFVTIYITCLFTVCGLTFSKGYTVLGIVGIFLPRLRLIGAILPAKAGSLYETAGQMAAQQQIRTYSQ
jgi:hypothetical protein